MIAGRSDKDISQHIIEEFPNAEESTILKQVGLMRFQFQRKWRNSYYEREKFISANKRWLKKQIQAKELRDIDASPNKQRKKGRPLKSFSEDGRKTKLRKLRQLTTQFAPEQLRFAAATSTITEGFRSAGKLIAKIDRDPSLTTKSCENSPSVLAYSADDALAFICANNFSKSQYLNVRKELTFTLHII